MLALLEALKSTVRDLVAREEKINSEYRAQSSAALNAFTRQTQAHDAAVSAQEAKSASQLEFLENAVLVRFDKRQARIHRAHRAVSDRLLGELDQRDEGWKDRTRQGVLEAETRRDSELAASSTAADQFRQKLNAAGEQAALLEAAARSAFGGYVGFKRKLAPGYPWPESDPSPTHDVLFAELQELQTKLQDDLKKFRQFLLPKLFKFFPLWLLIVLMLVVLALGMAVGAPGTMPNGFTQFVRPWVSTVAAGIALAVLVALLVIYFVGGSSASPLAKTIAAGVARRRRWLQDSAETSAAYFQAEEARIHAEFETDKKNLNQDWRHAARDITQLRGTYPVAIDEKTAQLHQKNEEWHRAHLEQMQKTQAAETARWKADADAKAAQLNSEYQTKLAQIEGDHEHRWQELTAEWNERLGPILERLRIANEDVAKSFPAWNDASWHNWKPGVGFQDGVNFGRMEVNVADFVEALPKDPRLQWPGPPTLSVPLSLVFPGQGSLLFESGKTGGEEAFGVINNIIFRLLSTMPPGKLSFTIFDPVGLGQNFSSIMHLADYEAGSINSRIWTQPAQFEEKLAELNEHMEKIIQMYLRNEYATIAEYNEQAGSVAEKYHFLVIASFPVNFTDSAARRLRNIAASGARCGVFTLVHWDQRNAPPGDFVPDELRNSVDFIHTSRGYELAGWQSPAMRLEFAPPPPPEFATEFLKTVGEASKDASRVEVPFEQIAPAPDAIWKDETSEVLRVPIGRSGATKLQYLEIGIGTRQHALIAGKTGSGKSTLFHVIITNLALHCSPEQVEFYLVDFKKGVEFKCYGSHALPHARVVAIESDREFGLSVLQRVDDELRRRGDLFRQVGAQNLAGYKRAGGKAMPRTLLMIDEFQEFFTEEDRISQGAAVLLDRIVRQGRAFGIHVLLGSQTLGGAYTLARATIGQMVIRIALQCNEADAYLIMDQDNPAPRLLSRPGEGIYNDAAGAIEGNSPFQAVWLDDRSRDRYLDQIRQRADEKPDVYPGPIVFEGNAPADVRENIPLRQALQKTPLQSPPQSGLWLGAPNSIKGPTEAIFRRQSAGNLLVVGQSEERTGTILALALVALGAQYPRDTVRFFVLDNSLPGTPQREFLARAAQSVSQEVIFGGNPELAAVMGGLSEELKRRAENETAGPEIFVLVQGLQNFKKLRQQDEFSFTSSGSGDGPDPAAILTELITEGPARGIHLIITCDTYNNVSRFLGRKSLSEFEMRVVFQMSASDSASLIDSPGASTLGLHRALFYNDREGSLETFRPYMQPDNAWLESVARQPALAKPGIS